MTGLGPFCPVAPRIRAVAAGAAGVGFRPNPVRQLGTLRRIARRDQRVVGSQAEAFTVFDRTQLVAHSEIALSVFCFWPHTRQMR
jgi:hypothetical protein